MENNMSESSWNSTFVEMNRSELILFDFDKFFFKTNYVIIVLYVIILITSLSANSLLIFIVIKFQYMKSVTNIFLVNLSVADLLVTLFCMPIQIAKSVTVLWYYGEITCKMINFFQGVAVASSVFTITAMSVDRYLAITQSLRQPWMPSRRGACLLLAAMWLVAFTIFTPVLISAGIRRELWPPLNSFFNSSKQYKISLCTEIWPDYMKKEIFGIFSFILVYAVPGFVVVLSYSLMGRRLCSVVPPFDIGEGSANSQQRLRLIRERKRVAWILLLLAVLFAFCWLPYSVILLLMDLDVKISSVYLPYTLLLGHANSAINPIVYCLMTRNFRRSLRKLFCKDPGNNASTTHIHMQNLHHQSNTSSCRTRSSLIYKNSRNQMGRTSSTPTTLRTHSSERTAAGKLTIRDFQKPLQEL